MGVLFGIGLCWTKMLSCSGMLCRNDGPRHLMTRWALMKPDMIKCPWKIWRRFVIKENLKAFWYRNSRCYFLIGIFLGINQLLNNLSWEQCRWAYPEIWVLEKTFRFGTFGREMFINTCYVSLLHGILLYQIFDAFLQKLRMTFWGEKETSNIFSSIFWFWDWKSATANLSL